MYLSSELIITRLSTEHLFLANIHHSMEWKLISAELVNKFPVFSGNRRFVAIFTTASHWSNSESDGFSPQTLHRISVRWTLILSSHLRLVLPNSPILQVFLSTSCMHFFISLMRATCPVHHISPTANHEAAHCAIFSSFLLLPPS